MPDPEPPRDRFPDAAYAGVYQVEGKTLTRISDGLTLLQCQRANSNPRKSSVFLVNASAPNRPYLSSLYGCELEVEGIRYRIVGEGDQVEIIPLYRRASRGPKRPVNLSGRRANA